MTLLVIIWIGASVLALLPVLGAAWRLRRTFRNSLFRLLVAHLLSIVVYNVIAIYIALPALFVVVEGAPSQSAVLLTIGHVLEVLFAVLFAGGVLEVFGPGITLSPIGSRFSSSRETTDKELP